MQMIKTVIVLPLLLVVQQVYAQDNTDPYLWLEKIDGEKALDWARSKNEETLAVLKKYSAFQGIYEKNLEIYNLDERIAYPTIKGDYLYNFWQDEKNERGIWRRTTFEEYRKSSPAWEVLLDIDALSEAEGEKWVYKGVHWLHPGYNRCMVQLSRGGGDAVEMREFNIESKQFVIDGFYLPEAKGAVSWKDKNTIFVSTNFGEGTITESGYPRMTKLWKRSTPLSEAKIMFAGDVTNVGVWGTVINTPERQYDVIYQGITFYTSNVYVIEDGTLIKLDIPEDANRPFFYKNQEILFFKNQLLIELKSDWTVGNNTYKQGSLISIDYDNFLRGDRNFSVIVEPEERSSIVAVYNTENFLLVNKLTNVRSVLYKYYFKDGEWLKEKVKTPDYGSISVVSTDENADRYFFTYSSFLVPSSLYFVSDDGLKIEKVKSLPEFFNGKKFEVKQLETTSKDGTRIPYFLVHAREMIFDGNNPTLLYGYGGFETSLSPSYSATVGTAWLDKGGVHAVANIRGGGEFGPKWHQAALRENRQRAYDDFIAVAKDLLDRKVTSSEHLGIQGRSNGGLLVGAVFTQRPELFNAVVCISPVLDMKRYNKLLVGASLIDEFGDPDKPEEWAFIKKYSPYHNIFPDRKYPKVFFYTSTKDDRAHPGHARKMVAKMEDIGHEVFYYENIEGGHSGAATNQQRAFRAALVYTYLLHQLR